MSEVTSEENPVYGADPAEIYDWRDGNLEILERNEKQYGKLIKSESRWNTLKSAFIAGPLAVGATAITSRIENIDLEEGMYIGFASFAGTVTLASIAEWRQDKTSEKIKVLATGAAVIYDGSRIVRPRWVEETLEARAGE